MALKLTLAVALMAACCAAQQQQLAGNYVDDFDYDSGPVVQEHRQVQRPQPQPQRGLAQIRPNTPRPTPVPILKQINRHNEDGSYTYGYEGADGTFKIETKFPTGDVKGKYGFVDDTGKVRVVEYGADRFGFQPAGEGITVAPPTLVDETTKPDDLPEEDGFYQERPRPRPSKPQRVQRPVARPPPPPPAPVHYQDDNYDVHTSFGSGNTFSAPPPPQRSHSPVPSRTLVIPGASPAPQGPPAFTPAHQPQGPVKAFQPAPRQHHFGPQQFSVSSIRPGPQGHRVAQQPQQARFVVQQAAPVQASRPVTSGGILDRLAKDYALPDGAGAPLHDISFGYY